MTMPIVTEVPLVLEPVTPDSFAEPVRELRCLDAERMALEVEAFVGALANDLIDAADFAR